MEGVSTALTIISFPTESVSLNSSKEEFFSLSGRNKQVKPGFDCSAIAKMHKFFFLLFPIVHLVAGICLNDCEPNSNCQDNTCICNPGWAGIDCLSSKQFRSSQYFLTPQDVIEVSPNMQATYNLNNDLYFHFNASLFDDLLVTPTISSGYCGTHRAALKYSCDVDLCQPGFPYIQGSSVINADWSFDFLTPSYSPPAKNPYVSLQNFSEISQQL